MDRQLLQAEIDAKKLLLSDFEKSTPADRAYWKAWDMAESIARRVKKPRPSCRRHVRNLIGGNVKWLERRLQKSASH